MQKFSFYLKSRKFKLPVERVSGIKKAFGLMFHRAKKAKALLFEFEKPAKFGFTSVFVFFPFVMVWLNKNNKVIAIQRIAPFSFNIRPRKLFSRALEIPFNDDYSEIIKNLVGRKHL